MDQRADWIQIRTKEMHEVLSTGLRLTAYKKGIRGKSKWISYWMNWSRRWWSFQDQVGWLDAKDVDPYMKTIYEEITFLPQMSPFSPKDSGPIDFAYETIPRSAKSNCCQSMGRTVHRNVKDRGPGWNYRQPEPWTQPYSIWRAQ